MLVIGEREVENGTVSVRLRSEENLGAMSLKDFVEHAQEEIESRVLFICLLRNRVLQFFQKFDDITLYVVSCFML